MAEEFILTVRNSLSRAGYCLIHRFDQALLLDFAQALGPISMDPRHPHAVRFISPQDLSEANPNTLSSRYGLGPFPFHTDVAHWWIPADIVLLYCVATGSGGRPTLLTDSGRWDLSEQVWRLLRSAVWRAGYLRPFLCTVAANGNRIPRLRYDPGCMIPRSPSALKAYQLLKEHLLTVAPIQIDWTEGDLLVLDNGRILHARGSAYGSDCDRVIARILIGGNYENVGFKSALAKGQSACRQN